MSNVWMIVADAMSASNVAGIATNADAPVDALVFGDAKMAEDVAKLGVASVTRYDVSSTMAEAYAPAIAQKAADEAPAAVVLSDNATARALAGAIAVKVGAAVATSVVSLKVAGAESTVEQLVAEGEAVQVLKSAKPVVCVIADGGPDAEEGAAVAVAEGTAVNSAAAAVSDGRLLGLVPQRAADTQFIGSDGSFHEVDDDRNGFDAVPCCADSIIWCQALPALGIAVELGPDTDSVWSNTNAHALAGATLIVKMADFPQTVSSTRDAELNLRY
jgi:hypothetical protein